MSEELAPEVVAPVEAPVPAETPATAPAPEVTPEAKAEPAKYDYVPAKFMKENGEPDLEKLAKSYTGLEKKMSAKANIPAASVEEYEYDFGDVSPDAAHLDTFRNAALENGLNKDQFKFVMDTHKGIIDQLTWTADKAEASLKGSWGKDYDHMAQSAKAAFDEYAPSDTSVNDPIWNHPVVMNLLARVGGELGEDSLSSKGGSQAAPSMTETEVAEIMRSSEYRGGNRELHAKVTSWYQKNRS